MGGDLISIALNGWFQPEESALEARNRNTGQVMNCLDLHSGANSSGSGHSHNLDVFVKK